MTREEAKSFFVLAGIPVIGMWELPNHYWPSPHIDEKAEDHKRQDFIFYQSLRINSPWWLVKTPFGMIEIGWRKRVININWEDTPIRAIVTKDDVTKSETNVHAWNAAKAVEYLQFLSTLAKHTLRLPISLDEEECLFLDEVRREADWVLRSPKDVKKLLAILDRTVISPTTPAPAYDPHPLVQSAMASNPLTDPK